MILPATGLRGRGAGWGGAGSLGGPLVATGETANWADSVLRLLMRSSPRSRPGSVAAPWYRCGCGSSRMVCPSHSVVEISAGNEM